MAGTIAYIDGLNFYYGALRNRPSLKWLNPQAMVDNPPPALIYSACTPPSCFDGWAADRPVTGG